MTTYNVLHLNVAIACMHGIPAGASKCILSLQQKLKRIASCSSIEMLKSITDKDGIQHARPTKFALNLSETIGLVQQNPLVNGQMRISLPPLIEGFKRLGLPYFGVDQPINPNFFQNAIKHFQLNTQTRAFDEAKQAWLEVSEHSAKGFDKAIKTLMKNVKGIDLYELIICTPLNPHLIAGLSVTNQTQYSHSLDKEIIQLICKNEMNAVCAVMCKSEINMHQHYVYRYIMAVQCEYVDDPIGIIDNSFVNEVQNLIEPYSNSRVYFQPCNLNGFMATHRFMKNDPQCKAQIKRLKTYLVGTDTLVRLHSDQPSFRILYTKF